MKSAVKKIVCIPLIVSTITCITLYLYTYIPVVTHAWIKIRANNVIPSEAEGPVIHGHYVSDI